MMSRTRGLIGDKRLILLSILFLLSLQTSYSFTVIYQNVTQGYYVKCYFFNENTIVKPSSLTSGVISYLCIVFGSQSLTAIYQRNVVVNGTLIIKFSKFTKLEQYTVPPNVKYVLINPPLTKLSFVVPVHNLEIIFTTKNLNSSIYTVSLNYNTIKILRLPYQTTYIHYVKLSSCPSLAILKLEDSSGISYTNLIYTYGFLNIKYNSYPVSGVYLSFNNSLFLPIQVYNSSAKLIKIEIIPRNKTILKINNIKIPIERTSTIYIPFLHNSIYVNNILILFSNRVNRCSVLVSKHNEIYHNCALRPGSLKISISPEINDNATMAKIEIDTPVLYSNVNVKVLLDNLTIFNETLPYLYGDYVKIIPIPGGISGKHHYCVVVNIKNSKSINYCKDFSTPVYNPSVLVSFKVHSIPLEMVIFFWILATSVILVIITRTKRYFE